MNTLVRSEYGLPTVIELISRDAGEAVAEMKRS